MAKSVSREVEEVFPLSPLQRGIMFHCLSEPESGAYVENHRFVFDGLDAGALRRAFELVVACYPALRTSVVGAAREVPAQVVWSKVELAWREHDARSSSAAEQEAWIASYVEQDRKRGFALDSPSLTRFMLVRCGDRRYQLIWTIHHIVLDGWSGQIVRRAAFAAYASLLGGETPKLVTPRPFSDFVAWLRDQDAAAAEAYWRRRLAGLAEPTRVDGGSARASITRYAVVERRLPAALTRALRQAAARGRVTLNILIQGAWSLLLSRYSGRDSVVYGTVVSGRPEALEGVESMVGMFINTVPFHLDIPRSGRVDAWLRSVQALQIEQRPHEWSPLWEVQRWSGLPATTPLFEALYVFQNQSMDLETLGAPASRRSAALPVGALSSGFRTGYPLVLAVVPGQEVVLSLEVDADRYERVTIERMLWQLGDLLAALARCLEAAGDSQESLSWPPVMSPAERHQALVESSDSTRRLPAELLIHRRIARRAATAPDAVVMIGGDLHLSHGALVARARGLASRLRRTGIGVGARVGLCVERGPEMVAALLAILESGAAYVPLDPELPARRLAYMARDAGLAALISERRLADRAPAVAALADVVDSASRRTGRGGNLWLDAPGSPMEPGRQEGPIADPAAGDLAYVIYTSGSTGRPKGVQLSHRNVVNFLRAMVRQPGLDRADTMLAVTTLSFDIAVLELLAPLEVGARTVIATSATAADGERLARLLERSRTTVMQATPATWQLLVQIGWPGAPGLKLLSGGEALPPRLAAELASRCGELWNLYGPTETTVWSAATRIDTGDDVTLGRPIDNTRLYVLDARSRPVSREIPGQLAIAGTGLARGYLGRPALTAGSFCPDPFAGRGERLYLTGDLVRRDGAGCLIYLGRLDHQVKLRGFRIELGEIEAALETVPAVERAVVLLYGGAGDDCRLVAYLLATTGREEPPETELRARLSARLPDYMVPASFVWVGELPLTPSGKIDRKALNRRLPDAIGPASDGGYEAPRGAVESAVATAFAGVLHRRQVGRRDSFFALGGHSLLAARVVLELRASLDLELPLRAVFEAPTVADLAARVQAARSEPDQPPPIEPMPRDGALPASFGQERLWFLEQLEPGNAAYRLTGALWIEGALDVHALRRGLEALIRRHESLRTTFSADDGVVRQVISEKTLSVLELERDRIGEAPSRAGVDELIREESTRVFDLEEGPLIRARLIAFSERRHLFLLCLHHIVTDGWSQGILWRELSAFYEAFRHEANAPSPLPELAVQYPDFAAWQRRWLDGEVLERQLAFWRQSLDGVPALELPADRPRPTEPSQLGGIEQLRLPDGVVEKLAASAGIAGTTPFMALLAGLAGLLFRLTGQRDFAVGSPVANRRRPELEGLIGLFINVLALRVDLSGEVSYRQLLKRVRKTSLAAFDHQDLPFEKLVDELAPERHRGRSPLFQVLFVLQNMEHGRLALAGSETRPAEFSVTTTRYDLELYAWQRATEDGWRLAFVYSTDLFAATRIRRLARYFVRLLSAALAEPDALLSRLPLQGAAERHQALVEDSDTARRLPAELLVHRRIAHQAAKTPDRLALIGEHQQLTYGALTTRAGELARRLQSAGAGPGALVGLCVERGPEMVAALLAVLESGAAYVPLDPGLPAERLAYMAADAGLAVLLSERRLAARVSAVGELVETMGASVLWLGDDGDQAPVGVLPAPVTAPGPDDLAYVIYTSGSTGRPKGVQLSHLNVTNFLRAMAREPGLRSRDIVLAVTTLSFDIAVLELLLPLTVGARSVIATSATAADGQRLARLLARSRASVMQATPATWQLLVQLGWQGDPNLDMLCGGEALPPRLAADLVARGHALWNLYGPTETTVWSSTTRIVTGGDVTLGRPIDNTRLYVLDKRLQPAPAGVPGQLAIAGAGLARGYLGRPALSAGSFCPDPFAGRGERLYLTGDLVRRDAAGRLIYLGRLDHQIKLRGFRIELGEIEASLGRHPAVAEAAVILAGERLVGYVQPDRRQTGEQEVEHVDQWQAIWNQSYGEAGDDVEPTFDLSGWKSSYTGEPIPAPEMAEWVDLTVAGILSSKPRSILEIGVGTGLLLFRLASKCRRYAGIDVSPVVIDRLRRRLGRLAPLAAEVTLERGSAEDLTAFDGETFDAVVVNSVIQYFPSASYLLRALEAAVGVVKTGGVIFVGDVRNLRLLETYHAAVQLYRAPPDLPVDQLRQLIRQGTAQEEELVVDPSFFVALARHLPAIARVEIRPKQGRAHNELTRFRYDVVLHVGERSAAPVERWIEWPRQGFGREAVRTLLEEAGGTALRLRGVPNARTAREARLLQLLDGDSGVETVAELRAVLEAHRQSVGVDPEALGSWVEDLGYEVHSSWLHTDSGGRFDVVFRPHGAAMKDPLPLPSIRRQPWASYANQPLQAKLSRQLGPRLRAHLRARVPEYMVPATFVILPALPLTPSGKLDRRALPAPEDFQRRPPNAYVAPGTPVERSLCEIWSGLLGVEQIGVEDDFFDLGGHSILATQLVSRMHDAFGVELLLRDLFAGPTVRQQSEAISRQLADDPAAASPPLTRLSRDGELSGVGVPLSFGQERLWFLEQLEPGNPAYHLIVGRWVEGALEPERLGRALRLLVLRHEALRTTFRALDGQPVQTVDAEPRCELRVESDEAEDLERRALRIVEWELQRPFDLERGPLFRARLIDFGDHRHLLVLTLHHIVTDGWSQGILMRELSILYGACESGADVTTPRLPELEIQYPDFALWQRQWLSGQVLEQQLAYWRQQLHGVPPLELPADRARPAMASGAGGAVRLRLSRELVRRLVAAGGVGTTPFMVLLSGLAGLLARLTGQHDFAVGSPIANRRRTELEGLIGLFINTLALRVDSADDSACDELISYRRLLSRVKATSLAAFSHQDVPFERVVDELAPERHLGRSPLFQVLFALQNVDFRALTFSGCVTRPMTGGVATTRYDLELYAWQQVGDASVAGHASESGEWQLAFVYNADLFEAPTIRRWARLYTRLLASALDRPDLPLSQLPFLPAVERHQILTEDSDTARPLPEELLIHRRIAHQATLTPDAVAVAGGERQVTYGALIARSGELARRLGRAGVGAGARVGLCVERGPDMVAAQLAVLEAGAAYVPLDPGLPAKRLAYMADDAGLAALLSERRLARGVPAVASLAASDQTSSRRRPAATIWLDDPDSSQAAPEAPDRVTPQHPDELAYVIYTSGSTGRPKGVQLSHRNAVNFLRAMARQPGLDRRDTMLAVTTLSFDIAVLELLLPLMVGARTVIATSQVVADGERLARLVRRSRASVMQATPATWQLLIQAGWSGETRLKILCGGEALPPRLAIALAGRGRELWNLYGPTETTVWSACTRIVSGETVTLGRPIDNTRLIVLDPGLRPLPRGIPGQLVIAGEGLARGYLRRPALTAASFCPDPFGDPGERLYLTGDLVRRDGAGRLSYLGRLDHQVKLRGFRIELGEIEAALETLPAVERAVVLLDGENDDDRRLVAFLLSARDLPPESEMRDELASALPDYMIPSAFVAVAEYPLTASGKVDRKALGKISRPSASEPIGAGDEAPRGTIETAVATAFGEVLSRQRISRHASFFALGGHSLLATRAVARIQKTLDVELPVRAVFEAPTVAGLAQRLRGSRPAPPPILPRSGDEQRLPLSFGQERLWFLDRLEPGGTAFHLQTGWRWRGPLRVALLEQSLNDLVCRHEGLRTTFPAVDGSPHQLVGPPSAARLPVIDLSALPSPKRRAEIRRCAAVEAQRPFDLASGPLLRPRLLKLAEEEHLLLVTLHHIVSDEWSNQVLRREVREIYRARLQARPPHLAALPVQYADFALWQRQWLRGEQPAPAIDYWREQLGGEPAQLDLPFDRPRPRTLRAGGGSIATMLPAVTVDRLRAVARDAAASDFMILLAVFEILLMRVTGEQDLWIGTPVAGRGHGEIEELIGFFLNTLVLRSDLSGNPTFSRALARVRRTALEAYDHQEIPFEKLLEELQPERDLSRNPLFQVYCNMIQRTDIGDGEEPRAAGAEPPTFVESSTAFARFDLDLHLTATDGRVHAALSYKRELFDAVTIRRLLGWYRTLLESVAESPEQSVWALPLLGAAERRELEIGRGPSAEGAAVAAFPRQAVEQTVVARFEQQVVRAPDALAVRAVDRSWTYRQLDRAANRVARALHDQLGELAGERVALLFAAGGTFLEGMLGALKCGHVYVPLDPSYPRARLRFLLDDSGASAVVTESSQAELARSLAGDRARVVLVDRLADVDDRPVACPASAESMAYILYTSGSTGRPKGVMQTHRGLLSHVRIYARALAIGPRDRLTLLSSYTFDAAVMDAYGALLTGAAVCPLPIRDLVAGDLVAAMDDFGVTIYHSTPSVFRYLFGGDDGAPASSKARLSAVHRVVLGGEEARRGDLELFRQSFDRRCRLVNGLGPTESTLALQAFLDHDARTDRRRVPVGHGVDGTRIELLGPEGTAGQAFGEIAVHSEHLTPGYWRRPGRTAAAFTPMAGGGRRYRTGDLGRLLAGGGLEFVGRKDAQVKVRGHRVEPGEVETVLAGHPAVSAAAVVAMSDPVGGSRLAGYVVFETGRQVDVSELLDFLRGRLPDVLVPSTLQSLDALPLTPNGKLDRRALPAPEADQQTSKAAYVAPRTPIEKQLAGIWQELLAIEQVGVDDDFFELGGHSLLAARLVAAIERQLEVELPLRVVFEAPTVAAQEVVITRRLAEGQDEEELARMIEEIEGLSEQELQAMLEEAES